MRTLGGDKLGDTPVSAAGDNKRRERSERASRKKLRDAVALALLAAVSFAAYSSARGKIDAALATPEGQRTMVASDSRAYLEIADDFRSGNWSLEHVQPTGGRDRAHRQPLYPAMLAAVMTARGSGHGETADLAALATANVVLLIAAMWVAYAIGIAVFGSRVAGLLAAVLLWRIPYLWDNAATRLLTEPGYVLLSLLLSFCFLRYFATHRPTWLYATACVGALCYLQRVNGLFTAVLTMICVRLLDFGVRKVRVARGVKRRRQLLRRHAIATSLFILAAMPSWLPRLIHAHNPLYHGYLPNFLWVDDYQRAHVPGPPRYTWHDYVREHDLGDAIERMGHGLRRTLWNAPREKYGDAVAATMLAGFVITLIARDATLLAWYGVGLVQMLPLAWTALSNPVRRIPATALLSFGLVAAAAGTALAIGAVTQALARSRAGRAPLALAERSRND